MNVPRSWFSVVGAGLALFVMSATAATKTASAHSLPTVVVTDERADVSDVPPPGCYGCFDTGPYDPVRGGFPGVMGSECSNTIYLECAQCDYGCEYGFGYWSAPCDWGCNPPQEFEHELGLAIKYGDVAKVVSLIQAHPKQLFLDKRTGLIQWLNCNGNVDYKQTVSASLASRIDGQLAALLETSFN